MIAGYTMLKELKNNPGIYKELDEKCIYLGKRLHEVFDKKGIGHRINRLGSMISIHFCDHDIIDFESASKADIPLFNKFFHHMLENGIYLPPSAYESWFLSNALTYEDLDKTITAAQAFSI
jgi:glutamate-1-semialdehyde 2,1-aminomutase